MKYVAAPCPFCGKGAVIVPGWECYFARCINQNCQVEGPVRASERSALTAWNRRKRTTDEA
jgi:hypothetical protein